MEITQEQIIEAIQKNPGLIPGILPTVTDSEVGKKLIENKAELIYKEKIGEEVKKIHQQYDDDIHSILGERAGTGDDGQKQKTYEFAKKLYSELKELRGQKDSLSKDARVKELETQIEKLKTEGGGKHIQEVFDQAKQAWETEKQGYLKQITDTKTENEVFQKRTEIKSAVAKLKFNPDTPESIKNMVIANVEDQLIKTSKIENGKLVFVDGEGKPVIDQTTYQPKDAFGMISSLDAIKDITLKEEKGGGGAKTEIHGSIQTTKVEGKDEKKLILPEGSFKSKMEFINVAEKALLDSGITRKDPAWDQLKTEAYKEYKVSELPAQ